jgi:D-alanyl-D-alanine carboxypeptidase
MIKNTMAGRPWKSLVLVASLFMGVAAHATPVLVVDADNHQILHEEDAGAPWYPASTTKLMSALVVFEAIRAGEVSLTTPVIMSRNATKQAFLESGLVLGRTMTLEDALFAMITASANDVAVALAETVASDETSFVRRMNETAARIGLTAFYQSERPVRPQELYHRPRPCFVGDGGGSSVSRISPLLPRFGRHDRWQGNQVQQSAADPF